MLSHATIHSCNGVRELKRLFIKVYLRLSSIYFYCRKCDGEGWG